MATEHGHEAVVGKLLVAAGVDVNQATKDNGITPLWVACQYGHTKAVSALLDKARDTVDVNQATTDGASPLLMATLGNGHEAIATLTKKLSGEVERRGLALDAKGCYVKQKSMEEYDKAEKARAKEKEKKKEEKAATKDAKDASKKGDKDSKDKAIPSLLPGNFVFGESAANGVVVSYMQVLIFIVTFVTMIGLTLFISRSRLGRACRACAEDLKMANLLGINTNGIIALTFVIGAALAAIAAVLISMQYGVINPHIGFLAGIKAFTAAVLGGIGSIPGAMLGGLVLGVAEAFGADIFGDQYKDVVAFSLLVLVLLFRPTGILGRPEVEKV